MNKVLKKLFKNRYRIIAYVTQVAVLCAIVFFVSTEKGRFIFFTIKQEAPIFTSCLMVSEKTIRVQFTGRITLEDIKIEPPEAKVTFQTPAKLLEPKAGTKKAIGSKSLPLEEISTEDGKLPISNNAKDNEEAPNNKKLSTDKSTNKIPTRNTDAILIKNADKNTEESLDDENFSNEKSAGETLIGENLDPKRASTLNSALNTKSKSDSDESLYYVDLTLDKSLKTGESYTLKTTVNYGGWEKAKLDATFTGYNSTRCDAFIVAVQNAYTGKSDSTQNSYPIYEFVELEITQAGNLAGLFIESVADGLDDRYYYPAINVAKGERIVAHLRKGGDGCIDELGINFDEATAGCAFSGKRDLFDHRNEKDHRLNNKTDTITLQWPTGEVLDTFSYKDIKANPKKLLVRKEGQVVQISNSPSKKPENTTSKTPSKKSPSKKSESKKLAPSATGIKATFGAMQTSPKTKAGVYSDEWIALKFKSKCNLGGMVLYSLKLRGADKVVELPSVEIDFGEEVIIHPCSRGEGCISELGEDLNLSTAKNSAKDKRDIWIEKTDTDTFDNTAGVVLLLDKEGKVITGIGYKVGKKGEEAQLPEKFLEAIDFLEKLRK